MRIRNPIGTPTRIARADRKRRRSGLRASVSTPARAGLPVRAPHDGNAGRRRRCPRRMCSWLSCERLRVTSPVVRGSPHGCVASREIAPGSVSIATVPFSRWTKKTTRVVTPLCEPDPLGDLTRAEGIERVRKAVLNLPIRYREVVVLCDLQEMSYAEAADVLACAVGTVRSRLHRGRQLLATKLSAADPSRAASQAGTKQGGAAVTQEAAKQPGPNLRSSRSCA